MKRRTLSLLLALALMIGLFGLAAPNARAEELKSASIDGSEHVLQAGGLLPYIPAGPQSNAADPYAAVKKAIYDGLVARQSQINIEKYNISSSDVGPVFWAVLNDNPDLFYVSSGFSYSYGSSDCITSITPSYDSSYTAADVAEYQAAVQRIIGMLGADWSDVEKLLFLHDYLVTHCEYDLNYQRYNAHDALVVGSAVCQGYALAFNDLCRKSGINSSVISSQAINHAWNLVTIGGENCYVDCTWDDPTGNLYEAYCGHRNFLLSRDALAQNHGGTDWVSGTTNVYEAMPTSTRYDSAWWQDVTTGVPRVGHIGVYTLKSNSSQIYLRDLSTDALTAYALPEYAAWPVWGSGSSTWVGNFSTSAVLDGLFYFTLPTSVWSMTTMGKMNCEYELTDDELAKGYLYGIVEDGGALYYNLGTQPQNTSFSHYALKPRESAGFTYKLLDDGTASITGCKLTGDVVIPSKLDGYTVTNLAAELFYGTGGVTSVTIPATVTYFGDDASDNDWDYVFSYCFDLERIDVDRNNPSFCSVDGVLYSKDKTALINYPCSRAGEVYHAEADYFCCASFAACRNLKFLFIEKPDCVWYTYTFYSTPSLTVFYTPGGGTEQKVSAERQAGRVQDGSDDNPWCGFVSTEELHRMPANLKVIEADALRGTGIAYLVVPEGCERIEKGAFSDSALVYLRVGANTVIETGAVPDSVIVDRG